MADNIPPDDLAIIGQALFGKQWQTPMAKAFEISDRTVRRWASDGAPLWSADTFRALLAGRVDNTQRALDLLPEKADLLPETAHA